MSRMGWLSGETLKQQGQIRPRATGPEASPLPAVRAPTRAELRLASALCVSTALVLNDKPPAIPCGCLRAESGTSVPRVSDPRVGSLHAFEHLDLSSRA